MELEKNYIWCFSTVFLKKTLFVRKSIHKHTHLMTVSLRQPCKAIFAPNVTNKTLQNVKVHLKKASLLFTGKLHLMFFCFHMHIYKAIMKIVSYKCFENEKKRWQISNSARLIMCEKQNPNVDSFYKCFAVFSFVHIKAKPLDTFHNFQLLSHWNVGSNVCRCEKYTNI